VNSKELVARCPELLSYGQFNRWCNAGVFGDGVSSPGRGTSRDFTEDDFRVAVTLAQVSKLLEHLTARRTELLILLAKLIRDGAQSFELEGAGTTVTIDLQQPTP
jgi:hypothetical protein